jgi:hypothetical protein
LIEMINPGGVEGRRPPLEAVDVITLLEQKFGQVGAVLTGRTGDQCDAI